MKYPRNTCDWCYRPLVGGRTVDKYEHCGHVRCVVYFQIKMHADVRTVRSA